MPKLVIMLDIDIGDNEPPWKARDIAGHLVDEVYTFQQFDDIYYNVTILKAKWKKDKPDVS